MRGVRLTAVRAADGLALAAATAALALTWGGPDALLGPLALLVAAALAVPFFEWTSVSPPIARVLPRMAALAILVCAVVAWLSRTVGSLVLEPSMLTRALGISILPLAIAFALAPRTFSRGRALVPTLVGLLVVSGLDPRPQGYGRSALPFLGADHNAFAERFLVLASVAVVALWTGSLLESGPRWSRRMAAVLVLVVALAAAGAVTGVVGLPQLQPRVEHAIASAFTDATTGLSGESTLGEFSGLAVSRRRVLDLQTSLLEGAEWRLPSEVFTTFDGRRWTNPMAVNGARSTSLRPAAPPQARSLLLDDIGAWFPVVETAAAVAVDQRPPVAIRVTQADVTNWPLFLPRGATTVTAPAWVLEVDRFGLVRRASADSLRLYGALWSTPPPTSAAVSPAKRDEALSLPPHVDPRLSALALELSAGAGSPRAHVEATVGRLQRGYRYTLSPGAFRTDDPVAEFLFEKKAGYCEYFASAAVLLLRLQGVPARFVKGLSVGLHTDQGGGLHVVRESDAHAWIEAFVPGEGWVEADPTPPGQLLAARPRPELASRLVQRLRAALATAWARVTIRGPLSFIRWFAQRSFEAIRQALRSPLFWLSVLALAAARPVWRVLRAYLRPKARPPRDAGEIAVSAELRDLVREVERRWAAAGVARPGGRGLLEHSRRVPGAGQAIVEVYYRVRFGGESLPPAECERLGALLR